MQAMQQGTSKRRYLSKTLSQQYVTYFSRGEGAVQLRDGRQHPGADGHVAQGQQARRGRPRRQGQGEEHSLQKETTMPRQDSVRNWDGCWVKFSSKMEVELTRLATTFTSTQHGISVSTSSHGRDIWTHIIFEFLPRNCLSCQPKLCHKIFCKNPI